MVKKILNILLTPLRLILSHDFTNKIGLTSVRDDRANLVLKYVKGRMLDVGCGPNLLVKKYGNNSVGVDINDYGGGAIMIEDASKLPFDDNSFGTVVLVACLNHIPNRKEVLREINRLLKEDGIIILTMIGPLLGKLREKMSWVDKMEKNFIKHEDDVDGLTQEYLISLFSEFGFRLKMKNKFLMYLNNLYIFERK